jgi:hypothetical protein
MKSAAEVSGAVTEAADTHKIGFFLIDAPAEAFKSLAAAAKGRDVLLFNVSAPEDTLRRDLCAREFVHVNSESREAHFIDTASREVVANVLVDARPRFAQFKDDGSELWVSSEIGGTVSVIDPVKHEVRTKISFSVPGMRGEAIQPVGINFTRSGKTGFVAPGPANRIR